MAEGEPDSTGQCPGHPWIWTGFTKPEGTPGQEPNTKHQNGSLTLGLGFFTDHRLPLLGHWPIG
jgi:hypothetical protein